MKPGGGLVGFSRLFVAATCLSLLLLPFTGLPESSSQSISQAHWFEARTAHFAIYSCGVTQEVARVGARLEQFREAYSSLAGAQAVASPPIIVMAFPDHQTMAPFLPLYHGKPANLAAFFHRGSDENLIALYLSGSGAGSLDNVFHEYTHLLLRHNDLFWPLWLKEGMAEIYSTFEVTPDRGIRIGKPLEHYLRDLAAHPWLPLHDLFAVTYKSPEYNERERQGIFYAESWLLTHYLIRNDNLPLRAQFGQLTALLRQGQSPEQAFTNAFKVTLPQMETQLHRYLERGHFEPLKLVASSDLTAPRSMTFRSIPPVEVSFRLGDMLLRVDQLDAAEKYFEQARSIAPRSPLPYEGLGLLASERLQPTEAVQFLGDALRLGSTSFLSSYIYAREKYRLTAKSAELYAPLEPGLAAEIEAELGRALKLMPDFGPAHHLLGFFLMVQGKNLVAAEQQLQRAIQLEPENHSYLFSLAQAQIRRDNLEGATRTLEPLRLSYIDPQLRKHAQEMLKEINQAKHSQ